MRELGPDEEGLAGVPLCHSGALQEGGLAFTWDVMARGEPLRAFVLRFEGRIVAYLNRCAHVPAEMDWQPGRFLDAEGRWIVCAMHGAMYEPADGLCVAGPCAGANLQRVEVGERDGWVCWYPSREIVPVAFDDADASPAPGSPS